MNKKVVASSKGADAEGFAMLVIAEVMEPLDPEAVLRVADWLKERFHMTPLMHGLNVEMLEQGKQIWLENKALRKELGRSEGEGTPRLDWKPLPRKAKAKTIA